MPELPTYTATGRIQPTSMPGPSIDAAVRPWEAAERAGDRLGNLGVQLSSFARDRAAVTEQRQKEQELTWATTALSDFGRSVATRQLEDGKPENLRETEGDEFDAFSKERLQEAVKSAPSARAAEMFRQRAQSIVDNAWEQASRRGETVRLQKAEQANTQSAIDLSQSYKDLLQGLGPDGAAKTIEPVLRFQLASINERFAVTAPTLAAKMRLAVVEEMATATAATNPDFARQIVASSGATSETKLLLNNRIDSIQNSALELDRSRFARTLNDQKDVALKTGKDIPDRSLEEFKAYYGAERGTVVYEAWQADRKSINTANELVRSVGAGANPQTQARIVQDALASGDAAKVNAAVGAQRIVARSAELATKDPSAWQDENDPDLQLDALTLSTLPEEGKQQFIADYLYKKRARQLSPEPGDPHPERYLNRESWRALSAAEADARKRQLNAATPDNKLKLLEDLEAETGDPYLANKIYTDMLELGDEKIPVTYRFASVINNIQTRKEFVDAQTNMKALDDLRDGETRKEFTEALNAPNSPFRRFKAGWYGQSGEGADDQNDVDSAMVAYARHLQQLNPGLTAKQAVDTAMQRVVSENYGFAEVHGHTIPIGRKRMFGGPDRTDFEIKDIERRLQIALRDVPIREISLTNPMGTPIIPGLRPGFDENDPKDMQMVRDYVTRNGFWQMDESGEMLTLFIADGTRAGLAIRDKNGKPLTAKLDDIPSYSTLTYRTSQLGQPFQIENPELPKETYPLTNESWWNTLFDVPVKTHWPVRPTWMGSGGR